MSIIKLTPHQTEVILRITNWLDNFDIKKKPYHILTGYAGTGKTVLIGELVDNLKMYQKLADNKNDTKKVAICTLTWKAANVLRQRGLDKACSIHHLIYNAEKDPITKEVVFHRKSKFELQQEYSLIIVDEASMTDKLIRTDLATYEIPILYVGDSFQLPPISKDLDEVNFLANPDSQLTEILRQALDNPIIKLSMAIRQGQTKFQNGLNIDNKLFTFAKKDVKDQWLLNADQVILGYNKSRININNKIRALKGYDINNYPAKGEKLISLSNCREKEIFNGQAFTAVDDYSDVKFKPNEIKVLKILSEDEDSRPQLIRTIFSDNKTPEYTIPYKTKGEKELVQLSFGYGITCHKSQGSQWNKVVIFNEMFGQNDEEKGRWLYTAVTRAIDKLILLH